MILHNPTKSIINYEQHENSLDNQMKKWENACKRPKNIKKVALSRKLIFFDIKYKFFNSANSFLLYLIRLWIKTISTTNDAKSLNSQFEGSLLLEVDRGREERRWMLKKQMKQKHEKLLTKHRQIIFYVFCSNKLFNVPKIAELIDKLLSKLLDRAWKFYRWLRIVKREGHEIRSFKIPPAKHLWNFSLLSPKANFVDSLVFKLQLEKSKITFAKVLFFTTLAFVVSSFDDEDMEKVF